MIFFLKLFPLLDFLYLLQLEEYETKRYFNRLKRFFWKRNFQNRGRLVWTKRMKITALFAFPFSIVLFPFTPLWVGLVNLALSPYFEKIKKNIQKKAALKFSSEGKNTKVIMITGSFGKTTTKNYIYELVKFSYRTQMIPGNINTLTGIANWINDNFSDTSEILIAEVDPYYVGEIKEATKIISPDIAILINIGDQHLERLGNKKNLKIALNEIFKFAKPSAIKIRDKKTSLEYALEVARILKIPNDIVQDTVKKLNPPDRRGDIKIINNFEVIDQSYNISEATAKFNLDNAQAFAKKRGKKLIVITGGIPELGEENKDANKNLGKYLVAKADKVILLKSIFYFEVLKESDKFVLVDDLNGAWTAIKEFDSKKYMILIFPELNDLYY